MATIAPAQTSVDLMFLLSQASHALETELTARLAELGITPRSHCVLSKALAGGQTQSDLAEQCALDKTTMVVTIDGLERTGLAERRPSSTDRRARIISVTKKGEAMVANAQRIVDGVFADVLASLPSRERDAFVDALVHLVGDRLGTPVVCDQPPRRRAVQAPKIIP